MNTIEKFEHKGMTIRIEHDPDCEMPSSDSIKILYRKSSKYTLGDTPVENTNDINHLFPSTEYHWYEVYAYVHSGVALSLSPFGCPWDSGRSGFAVVKRSDFPDNEKARDAAKSFVDEMSKYLNGETYYFCIEDENGEHVDSCGGLIGIDWAKRYAIEMVDTLPEKEPAV